MNKEDNHTLIEVLNNDGDIKLTKFRNPRAIWQDNSYPDEYVFRDSEVLNVFQLIQENTNLKQALDEIRELLTTPTSQGIIRIPDILQIIDKVGGNE